MRLFIAICFSDEFKAGISEVVAAMKRSAVRGRFTRRENLHLTLVFIGETKHVTDVIRAMESIETEQFELRAAGLGRFKRSDGDIWWVGCEKTEILAKLQESLRNALAKEGFKSEDREYTPHITIGRNVELFDDTDVKRQKVMNLEMSMQVERISLMKSEHKNGRLVYSEIFKKKL